MSDHFLRSLDDIREEQQAHLERELDPDMALVSDYLSGELTEEQNARVRERLHKDPAFRDLADPLMLAYQHAPRRAPMPREELERKWLQLRQRLALPPIPGARAASAAPDRAVETFRLDVERHKRAIRRRHYWATAAMVVLVAGAPLALTVYRSYTELAFRAPVGQSEFVRFTDGSTATLAGGSRLRLRAEMTAAFREVVLRGEATFNVVAAAGSPFVVRTQAAIIVVTGTEFTVHAYENEATLLSVKNGAVSVQAKNDNDNPMGQPLIVAAGQRARVVRGHSAELIP